MAVSDNDGGQLASQATIDSCVSDSLLATVRRYYDANNDRAPNYGRNWKRVLITFRDVAGLGAHTVYRHRSARRGAEVVRLEARPRGPGVRRNSNSSTAADRA